jgi:hypothetical protein
MSRGRHTKPIDLKQYLPSKEGLLKFGKRATTVALIGGAALLGTKYMAEAIGTPPAPTFGENIAQIDDRFMDMAKGIALYAGAMAGTLAAAAHFSRKRQDTQDGGLNFLVGEPEDEIPLAAALPVEEVAYADVPLAVCERRSPTGTLIDEAEDFAAKVRAYELALNGQPV